MSWQSYVDTNLIGSAKVSRAAIIGQQGGVWASSAGYTLSAAEQTAVVNLFKNLTDAQAKGITLAGTKFFCLSVNDRSFYGKKQADGCTIVKTKQAILVAEYAAPIQAPECTTVVENLADYLISVNY